MFAKVVTSIILKVNLANEGKALLPTYASASIFRLSYRTSIVGTSMPTLKRQRLQKIKNFNNFSNQKEGEQNPSFQLFFFFWIKNLLKLCHE
jgi:hypothetical protein